jgi:hypothetical protein
MQSWNASASCEDSVQFRFIGQLWNSGSDAFKLNGNSAVIAGVLRAVDFPKAASANATPKAVMPSDDPLHRFD